MRSPRPSLEPSELGRFPETVQRMIRLAQWLNWTALWANSNRHLLVLYAPKPATKSLNIPTGNVNQKRMVSWAHTIARYSDPDRINDAMSGQIEDDPQLAGMLASLGVSLTTRKETAVAVAMTDAIEEKAAKQVATPPPETPSGLRMPGEWYEFTDPVTHRVNYVCRAKHMGGQPFYAKSKASAMGHSNTHRPLEERQEWARRATARRRQMGQLPAQPSAGAIDATPVPDSPGVSSPEPEVVTTQAQAVMDDLAAHGEQEREEMGHHRAMAQEMAQAQGEYGSAGQTVDDPRAILTQVAMLVAKPEIERLQARIAELEAQASSRFAELRRVQSENAGLRHQAEQAQSNLDALADMVAGLRRT